MVAARPSLRADQRRAANDSGSSDLRKADLAGSAERLEQIAAELRPEGAFRERPELGLQDRRLADTWLFVLPSTSSANAAVPYGERLRWFTALHDHLGG